MPTKYRFLPYKVLRASIAARYVTWGEIAGTPNESVDQFPIGHVVAYA